MFVSNRSTVDAVDDVTAALVDSLRVKIAPALQAADDAGIPRADVVLAWQFAADRRAGLVTLARKPGEWALPTAMSGGPANLVPVDISLLATVGGIFGVDIVLEHPLGEGR